MKYLAIVLPTLCFIYWVDAWRQTHTPVEVQHGAIFKKDSSYRPMFIFLGGFLIGFLMKGII